MDSVPDLTSLTTPEDMTVMMTLPGTLPLRDFREGKSQLLLESAGPLEQTPVEDSYCTEQFCRARFTMGSSQGRRGRHGSRMGCLKKSHFSCRQRRSRERKLKMGESFLKACLQ